MHWDILIEICGLIKFTSLSDVTQYLENIGYNKVDSYTSDCIIAYGTSNGEIAHFAKSEGGIITAKCGQFELVQHNDYDAYYSNSLYGTPRAFYVKN